MSDILKKVLGDYYNKPEISELAPLALATLIGGGVGASSAKALGKDVTKGALYGGVTPLIAHLVIREISKRLPNKWGSKKYNNYTKEGGSLRNYLHFSIGAYSRGRKDKFNEDKEQLNNKLKDSLSTVGITKL